MWNYCITIQSTKVLKSNLLAAIFSILRQLLYYVHVKNLSQIGLPKNTEAK